MSFRPFEDNVDKKAKPLEGIESGTFKDCMLEMAGIVIKSHLPDRAEAVAYASRIPNDDAMVRAYSDL